MKGMDMGDGKPQKGKSMEAMKHMHPDMAKKMGMGPKMPKGMPPKKMKMGM